MIRLAKMCTVGSAEIPIARVEDLIVMKSIAHRPNDLEDIRLLIEFFPNLNREEAISNLVGFAEVLEMPELADELRRTLCFPT